VISLLQRLAPSAGGLGPAHAFRSRRKHHSERPTSCVDGRIATICRSRAGAWRWRTAGLDDRCGLGQPSL